MSKRAARSTSEVAEQAAEEVLAKNGSAVDAVVAAYFAFAAQAPDALLAPALLVVAGANCPGRIFDGRTLQPGLGLARPRGATSASAIPQAARAAVPRAPQAVLLAHSAFGRRTLSEATRGALAAGKRDSGPDRGAFLKQIVSKGVLALRSRDFLSGCVREAGPHAGGQFTEADLLEAMVVDQPAATQKFTSQTEQQVIVVSDFLAGSFVESPRQPIAIRAAVAVDSYGLGAALVSFRVDDDGAPYGADQTSQGEFHGLLLEGLGVSLPKTAVPVRRGETRVAAQTVLGVPSALAIALRGPKDLTVVAASKPNTMSKPNSVGQALANGALGDQLGKLQKRSGLVGVEKHQMGALGSDALGWSFA